MYNHQRRNSKGNIILVPVENYVVLDIETTGFAYGKADIIEICAKKYVDSVLVDQFITLVKPRTLISPFITNLTGITDAMVQSAPTVDRVLPRFHDFIGNHILVAHNANFDIDFLYDASMDHLNRPLSNDFVDTLRLSRQFVKSVPNHKLGTLAAHFNLASPNHRAEQDVDVTNALYQIIKSTHF